MKSLYTYLNRKSNIDGHIHVFDHNGLIDKNIIRNDQKCVCFADIAFRYLNEYDDHKIISYYSNFIEKHYNPSKHILLSTANNAEDAIEIYNKFPNQIKGFGEFKCYSKWAEGNLPYGNLKWIRPVMEFNKDKKLPVYIHFNLDHIKKRKEFQEFIEEYNEIPIVLCHSGFVDSNEKNDDIYLFVYKLMKDNLNLYIDLSTCKTREYYINNLGKLLALDCNRIIIGSDINPIAKDVVDDVVEFSNKCYDQFDYLNNFVDSTSNIKTLFNITDDKYDELINDYISNFNTFNRHTKIHLLTRGNLIDMFPKKTLIYNLKKNSNELNKVLNLFENDLDELLNNYVLIGYDGDKRKREIGNLFKSVDDTYKKFLCLITILEMTYTFERTNLLNLIDLEKIKSIIQLNKDLLNTCIKEDKYNFKEKASTKYINSLFFIKNLSKSINDLEGIVDADIYDDLIKYFKNLYIKKPYTTTLYGITHILIGSSDFYQHKIDNKYSPLVDILYSVLNNSYICKYLTNDVIIEMMLCCKLFGLPIKNDVYKFVNKNDLEKCEHTNMLCILFKKLKVK